MNYATENTPGVLSGFFSFFFSPHFGDAWDKIVFRPNSFQAALIDLAPGWRIAQEKHLD